MNTILHNVQTGHGANRASYPMVAGELPKRINRLKRGADNLLRHRAEVKCATAICILSSTSSRPAMAPKELPIQWLQGNFPRGKSGQSVRLIIYYDLELRSKMLQLYVYPHPKGPDRLCRQKNFLSDGCRGTSQGDKAAKA
jgi:hypothetical protein